MKANRLIKELSKAVEKYGNISVVHSVAYGEAIATRVVVYDRNGNEPDNSGLKAQEIHIH